MLQSLASAEQQVQSYTTHPVVYSILGGFALILMIVGLLIILGRQSKLFSLLYDTRKSCYQADDYSRKIEESHGNLLSVLWRIALYKSITKFYFSTNKIKHGTILFAQSGSGAIKVVQVVEHKAQDNPLEEWTLEDITSSSSSKTTILAACSSMENLLKWMRESKYVFYVYADS